MSASTDGERRDAPDIERMSDVAARLLRQNRSLEAVIRLSAFLPPDQADVYLRIPDRLRARLIDHMPPPALAALMECLDVDEAARLALAMDERDLPAVLDAASPNVAADVLRHVPEPLSASAVSAMRTGGEVAPLLDYEDDDAGGLMTPEFIALPQNATAAQAMASIREWAREFGSDDIAQAYVLDADGAPAGSVGLAALALARPFQPVSLAMSPGVISVTAETDQEEVARLMERYGLRRVPVTDGAGRMIGVIGVEEIIDVIDDEATEDMYRMVGMPESEKAAGPFWQSVRGRLPWLCLNLLTALLAGLVVTLFESALARAVALAAFLPVIAGQGGIAGTQTLTLIVRSLALGELESASKWRLLAKELGLGLIHGLAVGALAAAVAYGWQRNEYLALVVGAAMLANMVIAGASGVAVPLLFRALKIDPALASAVAVTTVTDVCGFLIYLGLAAALIAFIGV